MANQSQVTLTQAQGSAVIRPAQAPRKTLLETIKEIEKQIEILESGPISAKQEQDLVKLKELLRRALGEQEKLQNQWKTSQQTSSSAKGTQGVATTSQPGASMAISTTQLPVNSVSAQSIGGAPPTIGKASPVTSGQEKICAAIGAVSEAQVLDKKKLQDLVREVDPNEQLDDDVEEMLLQIADDFIETVVTSSCQLAKHRKSNTLEVKDVQLYLERNWNIWVPGFGGEEIRTYKRPNVTEAHRQRMALIRKTLKK
ncbi:transcription initiation factor TFIID subunit 12-like [Anneissia japonica]|uniref:transcription initiation factor TFIID subunit 12-like n=1 Tax=Anneissia japonica TaxID=1529436 RepID=UPI001425866C|nr:transcription initiation factor TFIID subunit 12-like [Anneissia japonica]XP_033117155.1 transcription initiation factor TFIID subunit 12-like [Anneissia japonica]